MATYAIGDVQGCLKELEQLLQEISFDEAKDILWFTGDLVNRGPDSLGVLRFLKRLGHQHKIVLGNHDLHLLAVYFGKAKQQKSDTLDPILEALDAEELMNWLRHQGLLHYDQDSGYVMVHAGIAPQWTLKDAQRLALEAEVALRSDSPHLFLQNLYGNKPDLWNENLKGYERLRCIINYLTRMRFCYADGRLDLLYKGELNGQPEGLLPWFDVPNRANVNEKIIFGHWAALSGQTILPNLFALDTGCVWGNVLTAMRLNDQKRFSVKCGSKALHSF